MRSRAGIWVKFMGFQSSYEKHSSVLKIHETKPLSKSKTIRDQIFPNKSPNLILWIEIWNLWSENEAVVVYKIKGVDHGAKHC